MCPFGSPHSLERREGAARRRSKHSRSNQPAAQRSLRSEGSSRAKQPSEKSTVRSGQCGRLSSVALRALPGRGVGSDAYLAIAPRED